MKFAEIIRNSGLNACQFPNCANIEIHFYDGKDRLNTEENVHYVEPLFKNNEASLRNFCGFISGLEKEDIHSMNVRVDIDAVILFYKTPRAITFLRNPTMNPLDYMD